MRVPRQRWFPTAWATLRSTCTLGWGSFWVRGHLQTPTPLLLQAAATTVRVPSPACHPLPTATSIWLDQPTQVPFPHSLGLRKRRP
uniref:Putative secreted protein n=1 Tax=Ixodes ricinus TaxID=34613 RepID=A0A6B0U185_IXORI